MRKLYSIVLLAFFYSFLTAQDVHFSQYYDFAPTLNPALTGNYDGSYRVAAIYRNQWSSSLQKYAYNTPGAFIDLPLFEGLLRGDKIGAGIFAFNDISGAAGLTNLTVGGNLAYHLAFGKTNQHQISLGFQGAFVQKRIDPNRVTFFDQFDEISWSGYNSTSENLSRTSFFYGDFGAGLYWKSKFSKVVKTQLGISATHIQSFFGATDQAFLITNNNLSPLYPRISTDLGFEFTVKDRYIIAPQGLYMMQGPTKKINQMQEILVGMMLGYKFNTGFRNNTALMLGAKYRVKDAVIPTLSIEFRNFKIGAAYDITLSNLKASNRRQGAFEICMVYTGESIRSFKASKTLPARRF